LIGALILAAGAATRMGRLKQLLPYRGKTFLHHTIAQAAEAGLSPVVVVVGAEADVVAEAIRSERVDIVRNDAWQTGMGSSIAAGMRHLEGMDVEAVAILLADQPLITAEHLSAMAALTRLSNIVAAEYGGTLGVPAFFQREMFPALGLLPPEAGARQLLRSSQDVCAYPLPEAAVDVDRPEDLAVVSLS
jgi:molybdenum cofactor cytidylyltransferase